MACWLRWLALSLLALAAGCAQTGPERKGETGAVAYWSGRLAVRVEGSDRQSFSAGFELTGAAREGSLKLLSPLGNALTMIRWDAAGAQVQTGQETTHYPSLEVLLEQASGAPIPLRTLFDWLAGIHTVLPGWTADLSDLAAGRLSAQRRDPAPAIQLRLVLDPRGGAARPD